MGTWAETGGTGGLAGEGVSSRTKLISLVKEQRGLRRPQPSVDERGKYPSELEASGAGSARRSFDIAEHLWQEFEASGIMEGRSQSLGGTGGTGGVAEDGVSSRVRVFSRAGEQMQREP